MSVLFHLNPYDGADAVVASLSPMMCSFIVQSVPAETKHIPFIFRKFTGDHG
jgi:hypothetical protein